MKEKIVLLNVLRYSNAKGEGCRVGFIFSEPDKITQSDKFIGYGELAQFYSPEVFDKFDKTMIGKPMIAYFNLHTSPSNPLRTRQVLEKLEYNGRTINLV